MPIRYVSAVILAVAILVVGWHAIDHVATSHSQQAMESEIADIEQAATKLLAHEEVPPQGQAGAQRVIDIELPDGSLFTAEVEHIKFTPHFEPGEAEYENGTTVEYQLGNGARFQQHVDAPIVNGVDQSDEDFMIHGSGEYDLVLQLEADERGDPIITVWAEIDPARTS